MHRELWQGCSSKNKRDIFLTIRDPTSQNILCTMKNPKVPIMKPNPRTKFVDLTASIENSEPPNFGL